MDAITTPAQNLLTALGVWIVLFAVLVGLYYKIKGQSIKLYQNLLDYAVLGMIASGGTGLLYFLAKKLAELGNYPISQ